MRNALQQRWESFMELVQLPFHRETRKLFWLAILWITAAIEIAVAGYVFLGVNWPAEVV
jgi:hypothetical protein